MNDLRKAGVLMKQGHVLTVAHGMKRRLYSDRLTMGLHRDLTRSFHAPQARIPLAVRPLIDSDYDVVEAACRVSAKDASSEELMGRLRMLEAGIKSCYVAVDSHGTLCYLQWLMKADDNHMIQSYFHGAVPQLKADEGLIEGAYTFDEFRGLGVMACAMAQIAEKAVDFGARWVMTFVDKDNVPSLKGCRRAGFEAFLIRRECRRLFRRRFVFEAIPVG